MDDKQDIFHIMKTNRPMRRLKPDPVAQELLLEILDAASCAPNSMNTQPYKFLVVRERETKAFFGEHYDNAMKTRFARFMPDHKDNSRNARNIRTAMALGPRIKDVPVLLFVCGERDWPLAVPEAARVGLAPPSFGSVFPCVQNILLGCRAKGLGASLTTMHQVFEAELIEKLDIPATYGIVAVIPIGYPQGNFGPLTRRPAAELTYSERWGNQVNG
ncbi:MAG: nitroreductase family protein [Gammaproteobacteria bacterium]|jgi:nitroreductase